MKVKDLSQFLIDRCDPEADISISVSGNYYVPLAFVQQAYLNPETNWTSPIATEQHTQFGLFLFGPDIGVHGEMGPEEKVIWDPELVPDLSIKE